MGNNQPNLLRRRLLQSIPTSLLLGAFSPSSSAKKSSINPFSLGYTPSSKNGVKNSVVIPATMLPDAEIGLAKTGARITLGSFLTHDVNDYYDFNITLFNNMTVDNGETIPWLIWQLNVGQICNCSAPAKFNIPLLGNKLSLELHGRMQKTKESQPVEWRQPVLLTLDKSETSDKLNSGTYFLPLMSEINESKHPDWLSHLCEYRDKTFSNSGILKSIDGENAEFSYVSLSIKQNS